MTIDELIAMLEMQEEILQFSHFTNEDAWELGCILVAEAKRRKLPVAVSIRLNNGAVPFQYESNGITLDNEEWMERKQNTVRRMEKSSFLVCMLLKKAEQTLEDWRLDAGEYAAAGGAFPIRVEEVGVIGSVVVSGLDHISNHDLLVKCISHYLHIDEVPRIRGEVL